MGIKAPTPPPPPPAPTPLRVPIYDEISAGGIKRCPVEKRSPYNSEDVNARMHPVKILRPILRDTTESLRCARSPCTD